MRIIKKTDWYDGMNLSELQKRYEIIYHRIRYAWKISLKDYMQTVKELNYVIERMHKISRDIGCNTSVPFLHLIKKNNGC